MSRFITVNSALSHSSNWSLCLDMNSEMSNESGFFRVWSGQHYYWVFRRWLLKVYHLSVFGHRLFHQFLAFGSYGLSDFYAVCGPWPVITVAHFIHSLVDSNHLYACTKVLANTGPMLSKISHSPGLRLLRHHNCLHSVEQPTTS